ncbi:unnamed protein product [Toxocara canis]|uniref:Carn_acyltransf domain-containing protein n=1 Tax=Toxocara canis TaxID=6265 RepID=A0A183TX97_TOXCA|nr:unnamed protein product [Toxocara canis]
MSVSFELFGNERFKASKVYGDTIIQMALQLAFYRTHGKLAPAYETASTRQFFHGRTETVRSCTAPLAKLVRLIVDDHKDVLRSAFVEAYETHNRLMNEAMEGKGKSLQQFLRSFVGYDIDGSYGYVSPMCEDGYGAFYKIGPNRYVFYSYFKLTDLRQMGNNIKWSLEYLSQFFPISSRV